MDEKTVWVVGIFLTISLCWWSPPFAYGQLTDPNEVTALLGVRRKLNDNLKYLNWSQKHDPCTSNWTGVKCFLDQTDGFMHVQELRLMKLNLSGTLAPELGLLPNTRILDLMWNNISGSIPKEIGNIKALQLLNQSTVDLMLESTEDDLKIWPHR